MNNRYRLTEPIWNDWLLEPLTIQPKIKKPILRDLYRMKTRRLSVQYSLTPADILKRLSYIMDGGLTGLPGIDLSVRGGEVKKLFYGCGFAHGLQKDGIDPEEVLQEVYRGIIIRNSGICPYDYEKSTFGHYVYMVTSNVVANYIRKWKRRKEMEELSEEGEVSGSTRTNGESDDFRRKEILFEALGNKVEAEKAYALVKALEDGQQKYEAAKSLGVSNLWTDRTLRKIRDHIRSSS